MTKLLSSDYFDSFLLAEATIRMAVTYHIDGKLNEDFYDSDVWNDSSRRPYDLASWQMVRPYCRDCIKGNRAPASFHFTLLLKPEFMAASLSDVPEHTRSAVSSLLINIRMNTEGQITLLSGISYQDFVLDKSAEPAWDKAVENFLQRKGIDYEKET